jgi:hypothetical protein
MAKTDVETLQIALVADLQRFEQNMMRMTAVTEARTRMVEKRVASMTGTIRRQTAAAGSSMNGMAGQTGNIAAQFQDIGVQLAGGQSPFLIALQQGTQLTAVLSQAKNPVQALGAAFLSLANPISLATIAAIALGGAAVQWLTKTQQGVASTDEAFETHVQRIKEITRGYEDAEKAALDYVERQRTLPQELAANEAAEGQAEALERAGAALDALAEKQRTIAADLSNLSLGGSMFEDTIKTSEGLDDLGLSASSTEQEVNALLVQLDNLARSDAPEQTRNYARDLYNLVLSFRDARTEAGSFKAVIDSLPRNIEIRLNLATNAQSALQQLRDLAPELRDAATVAREEAISLADRASLGAQSIAEGMAIAKQLEQTLTAINEAEAERNSGSSGGAGRTEAIEAAEAEREAVKQLIEQLQFEQSMIGASEAQKATANALRQAGAAATDEQRQAIAELIGATYAEQQAIDGVNAQMQELETSAATAVKGFVQDLRAGKTATEALDNALGRMVDNLLNKGIDTLFSSLFGGFTGGGFGTIGVGGVGAPSGGFFPGLTGPKLFARGGIAREASIFGEAGPEAAVPLPDGRRIPVDLRMPQLSSPTGGLTQISVVLSPELEGRILDRAAGQTVQILSASERGIIERSVLANGKAIASGDHDRALRGRFGIGPQARRH